MKDDVTRNEQQYQQYGNAYRAFRRPASDDATPGTSQFKEEKAHRHVAKTHPQGILHSVEPVADEGEYEIYQR